MIPGCIRWCLHLASGDVLVPIRFTVEHVNGDDVRGTTDGGATVIRRRRAVYADKLAATGAIRSVETNERLRRAHALS